MTICGPESLEIILALRETVSGGYLAFAVLIIFNFHCLNKSNKKGIAVKFKRTFAFRNEIAIFLCCSGLLTIVLLMHLSSAP